MRPALSLAMRQTSMLGMRQTPMLGMRRTQQMMIRQSPILRTMPKQEQSAHTISQRIRQLRQIPTELIPLAVVIGVAIAAAVYSMGNKLMSDTTLRLKRQGPNEH